ncbi:MAG: beta-phosphoglucomutase family hydrolase [Candidatus Omnitrophica bacterium]|nr:beta-phosphoglucomutase family hydrolase [Candidatus Omnitrophota bacterium]
MEVKTVIFDLDGVLVDTIPLHFKAWHRLFKEQGKAITFEDYKHKIDGIPTEAGIKAILPGASEEVIGILSSLKREYFLLFLKASGVIVHQDAFELIHRLRSADIALAVISSSTHCRFILEKAGLSELFDAVVSSKDIAQGKPAPDIFFAAADILKVSPAECVVIEDAVLGVEAAKRAGMRCVGIDRYRLPLRLKDADIIVDDLSLLTLDQLEQITP